MIHLLIFPFFYLKEIASGALRVAKDVISPHPELHPIMLRVPINLARGTQRLLLANLISMTPGTISVREEEEGKILLVHSLYGGKDPQAELNHIKERYEKIVARLPI